MRHIDLGKSGLLASEIALGCMRLAGLPVGEAATVIRTALDNGINFFEHADIYGADGASEELFGKAAKELGLKRDEILVQTKCGIERNEAGTGIYGYNFERAYIIKSVEHSLKRLQTEYVDVLALHRPDTLMEPDEVAAAFDALHSSGKVRHFGVSNQNPGHMALLQKSLSHKLLVNQIQFSLAHTGIIDYGFNVNTTDSEACSRDGGVLDYCRLNDVTIQAWSPFLGEFPDGVFIDDPAYQELNSKMAEIAEKHTVTKDAIAVAWILRHPAKIQPVIGSMSPQRIANITKASSFTLTHHEWYALYMSAGNSLP